MNWIRPMETYSIQYLIIINNFTNQPRVYNLSMYTYILLMLFNSCDYNTNELYKATAQRKAYFTKEFYRGNPALPYTVSSTNFVTKVYVCI